MKIEVTEAHKDYYNLSITPIGGAKTTFLLERSQARELIMRLDNNI